MADSSADWISHQILLVRGHLAGEETAVDSRVQGLDASTKHFWCLGDGGDVLDRETTLPDHFCGTARSQNPATHVSSVILNDGRCYNRMAERWLTKTRFMQGLR